MTKRRKEFDKGVRLRPDNDALSKSGEFKVDSGDDELKVYLGGSERAIVSEDQTQTLTNKTINADNNTISNLAHGSEVDNPSSGVHGVTGSVVGTSDSQTLTNKTIDGDNNTLSDISLSSLKTILADANKFIVRDGSGIVISSKSVPSGDVIGSTDSQTLTNKTIDADLNTISNLAHGAEVDDSTSGVHGVTGNVVGTSDSQSLTNKTIDGDLNTISNLAHGSEVDNPSSGVHGVTGNIVGTSDSQVLTNKDIDGGTASNSNRLTIPKNTTANLNSLTRKEATLVYSTDEAILKYDDGSQLLDVGTGAGGSGDLDVYHTDTIDQESDTSKFSTGNNASVLGGGTLAGTLALESTNPLAGDKSLKFIQAAGSLNDYVMSEVIDVDQIHRDRENAVIVRYTYDGNDNDIRLAMYDVTNGAELELSGGDIESETGDGIKKSATFFIPTTCQQVRWGFQVETANNGAILLLDNIVLDSNPFTVSQIDPDFFQPIKYTTDAGQSVSNSGDTTIDFEDKVYDDDNLVTTGTWQWTAPSSSKINVRAVILYNSASWTVGESANLNVYVNGSFAARLDQFIADETQSRVVLLKGLAPLNVNKEDTVTIVTNHNRSGGSVTLNTNSNNNFVGIEKIEEKTDSLSVPSRSNLTDWESFTPTGSWTTNTTYTGHKKRIGDTLYIKGKVTLSGAPNSANLTIDIPDSLNINTDVVDTYAANPLGQVVINDGGANNYSGRVTYSSATSVFLRSFSDTSTEEALNTITDTAPVTFASGDEIHFEFKVPISEFTNQSSTFLAAFPFNKFQTNYLSSNITANDSDVADLKFTGLVVGRVYEITGQANFDVQNSGNARIDVEHNSSVISRAELDINVADRFIQRTAIPSITFEATASTVVFNASVSGTSTFIGGDGTAGGTFVTIKELPLHKESTRF